MHQGDQQEEAGDHRRAQGRVHQGRPGARRRPGDGGGDLRADRVLRGLRIQQIHTAAYAQIGYQTAYLKAHYTAEFMAALLSSEIDDGNKRDVHGRSHRRRPQARHRRAAAGRQRGRADFDVQNGQHRLRPDRHQGARPRRRRGDRPRPHRGRAVQGPLRLLRADRPPHRSRRRRSSGMVMAGAFDAFGRRAAAVACRRQGVPGGRRARSDRGAARRASSTCSRRDADTGGDGAAPGCPTCPSGRTTEKLKFEKEALDFYISSHPLAQFDEQLKRFRTHDAAQVAQARDTAPRCWSAAWSRSCRCAPCRRTASGGRCSTWRTSPGSASASSGRTSTPGSRTWRRRRGPAARGRGRVAGGRHAPAT